MLKNRSTPQLYLPVVIVVCLLLLNSLPLHGQSPTETKAIESLKKMFGDSISASKVSYILSNEEKRLIAEHSKTRWTNDTISVFRCSAENHTLGYGFLDDVKGKMQFITYIVGVVPAGEIRDVDVLVYRESYGGEIGYESFRKQFRGKTAKDDLRPGPSIKNISGATISVRAITLGIQRVLTTYSVIQQKLSAGSSRD